MNTLPRLLITTSTYPRWQNDPEPGFVHELARRLTRRFDVTVLAPHAAGALTDEVMDGVTVHRFRYAPARLEVLVNDGGIISNLRRSRWKWLLVPLFLWGQLWAEWRLMRRWHPAVIHAHWLIPQGLLTALLSVIDRHTPPFLVTAHGADLFALRGRLARYLKRCVAAVCAGMSVVSSAMREAAGHDGLKPPRLDVLPMGVDLQQRFVPGNQQTRSRDELLFVGRLVPKKGLNYLLDALPAVLQRRPAVKLKIAGFGPEETALKRRASQLGIEDRVEFIGAIPQSELPELYRHAALVVAPFVRDLSGDQEGLPVALMEAVGCGCPVIAGNVAGLGDLLGEMSQSICVNPADAGALAAAIVAALENPERVRTQALTLRARVVERIDWDVIADSYAGLLHNCLKHSNTVERKA